jgi:threonine 3-dehydrogenase
MSIESKKLNGFMSKEKILIIGANGQLGAELTRALRQIHGQENVIATDLHLPHDGYNYLPFEILDATDASKMSFLAERYRITQIYHLAAVFTNKGEVNPLKTWEINMNCLFNVMEVARVQKVKKVFFPSSIAVFGSNTPRIMTPQDTIRTPETVYGMSKVAGENWCSYYHNRYGTDVRSLRYPGVVDYQGQSRGSTADYALEMYHKAVKGEVFECFLNENTRLPFLFIDDAVRATLDLMDAPEKNIAIRSSYNVTGFSATPAELADSIRRVLPDFKMQYNPDERQKMADSWPESIDDMQAFKDWGWRPKYDLDKMTDKMIATLQKKYAPTL